MRSDLGLGADRIVISAKVTGYRTWLRSIASWRAARLCAPCRPDRGRHGDQGHRGDGGGLALLLQEGIGDTIRVSLTPAPGEARTTRSWRCQEVLQSLGLRAFTPQVAACPGCGRTTSTLFQELADRIQTWLRDQMPVWQARYPGVESMNVAVMGCIVNGPGESKHADIGISLPGTGERRRRRSSSTGRRRVPCAATGSPRNSRRIVESYIERRYGRVTVDA